MYTYLTLEEETYMAAAWDLRQLVRVWVQRWYVRNGSLCNRAV